MFRENDRRAKTRDERDPFAGLRLVRGRGRLPDCVEVVRRRDALEPHLLLTQDGALVRLPVLLVHDPVDDRVHAS